MAVAGGYILGIEPRVGRDLVALLVSTGCCGAGTMAQEASFPVIGVVGTSDMFSEKERG